MQALNIRKIKMINKELLERFWKDYYIATQEERTDFPYANVADAGRALIKGRNWTGTFTELLLINANESSEYNKLLNTVLYEISSVEREILSFATINSYVAKSKELLRVHIWANASPEQKDFISKREENILNYRNSLEQLESEKGTIELVLKKLEKTTDWLVQYINWQKFELRGLQQ